MTPTATQLRQEIIKAAGDTATQDKIAIARSRYLVAFHEAAKQFSDLELARKRAAFRRRKAIENLDSYLIEFEANFIKSGGKVIWAQDAAEACSEIIAIINRSGEKEIVKSKSLTTDEIGLDAALKEAGLDHTETDLGQFILQVAGDKPSHMVMPALHYSKSDVGQLFHDILGMDRSDEPERISAFAAQRLRKKYETAGVGITGANFLIADPGAISITENEGNAWLATAKPRIHIAVAGIDKVLPSINDLALFLPLLSTYGTGQSLTAYNTVLRGPKRIGETDGPGEMYVVLIDNGRSKLLKEEQQRSLASCIRCGACLYHDPVYAVIGGKAYQSSWIGPPATVALPFINGIKSHGFMAELSTLSGADTENCPVRINFNKILLDSRHKILERSGSSTSGKMFFLLWKTAMLKRDIVNWKNLRTRNYFMNTIFLKSPTGARDMKKPEKESFNEWWRKKMNP
ncbi:MAG TPA: LUD domain-containing protein [Bacteroidia bacterium]|nr:LUD domain-containing protein [Bacteroidia bacterium]